MDLLENIFSEKIVAIACGRVHTVLLSAAGTVYASGGGTYGQLGTKTDPKKRFTFEVGTFERTLNFGRSLVFCCGCTLVF